MFKPASTVALPALFLGALSLWSPWPKGLASAQGQGVPPPDPLARLERLQQEVSALKIEVARLRGQSGAESGARSPGKEDQARRDMEQVVLYLRDQAQAAKLLQETLDAVEAKGFTAGINPDSRATLLAGWRAQLAAMQANVPGAGALPAAKPAK